MAKHLNMKLDLIIPTYRFVATSGFTPDVKVWEVKFSRSGDFEKAARAFDLTGVICIHFHSHWKTVAQATGVVSTASLSVQTVGKWRR